jgi:hypothetical protein
MIPSSDSFICLTRSFGSHVDVMVHDKKNGMCTCAFPFSCCPKESDDDSLIAVPLLVKGGGTQFSSLLFKHSFGAKTRLLPHSSTNSWVVFVRLSPFPRGLG